MRKPVIFGAIAVVGVLMGTWYFTAGRRELTTVHPPAARGAGGGPAPAVPATPAESAAPGAASSDPRFRALAVSADNGLIEFVRDADGRVIMEIDRDPASARFGKPAREYTYSGSRVVGLTSWRQLGDQLQVSRIMVAYRPDGSIQDFSETTDYQPAP